MAEYITKEQAISVVTASTDYDEEWLVEDIKELPPADVAPVVHARWIEDEYAYATCSHCGYEMEHPEEKTPYCPHCGARMDGDEE